jgi:oxygen-independent coproporphyrinogen III oxidase
LAHPWRPAGARTDPFGLYIHIPFCERKCPYCDFNTYAGLQNQFQAMVDALCAEMARWQAAVEGRRLTSIFIGGGTPTILNGEQLAQLFAAVARHFSLAPGCEISCEANPGAVDREKFQRLHALGVNRLSLGVQSFQPEELAFLGRIHGVEDVLRAYGAARAAGFHNINLDFMFGLPGQPLAAWQDTLRQTLALGPEHLSLYSLIVEPNTPLFHWVETGKIGAPDEDLAAEHFELAMEMLAAGGYHQYEVSNWAAIQPVESRPAVAQPAAGLESLPPQRACRHNLLYWRNGEYLGIGPGAHSHLRVEVDGQILSRRWGNRKPVAGYIKRIQAGEAVEEFSEELSPRASMGETMMLGLRLVDEGVAFDRFRVLHHADLRDVFAVELARLIGQGLLQADAERLRLTPQGLLLGNQVFAAFLAEVESLPS